VDELVQGAIGLLVAMLTAATPFLVAYAVQYLRKQLKKVGLEATDQEIETIKRIAAEGIAFAAQKAKLHIKTEGATPLTGKEKKELAMSFARKLAGKYSVSDKAMDVMDDLVEAALAKAPDL
jgi:hypothetical protein